MPAGNALLQSIAVVCSFLMSSTHGTAEGHYCDAPPHGSLDKHRLHRCRRCKRPNSRHSATCATPRLSSASLPSDDDPVGCLTLTLRSWRPEAPRREPPETVHAHNEVAIPWHCACYEPVLSCAVTDWVHAECHAKVTMPAWGRMTVGSRRLDGQGGQESHHGM